MTPTSRSQLVVLGTGFAAFSLLRSLNTDLFDATVISPRNHFLFTPLLPSTTVGTLEFRSIIEPIRKAFPRIRYHQGRCTAIDTSQKEVVCESVLDRRPFRLRYDILVVAVGAVNNTYNIEGVEEHALFLKEIIEARQIRERIIDCFERASQPSISEERRKSLLRFVVVGGGPTGVEFAAEMHDFVKEDLRKAYAPLMQDVSILILEAGPSILSTFDAVLSNYTARLFRRQQIEVMTNAPVIRVGTDVIELKNGTNVPYGLLVWSTGIGPTPVVRSLPFPKTKTSRILTDEFFRVKAYDGVFAVGDCATFESFEFPATSQVAQQEGRYLARTLLKMLKNKPVKPFRYHHYGMLAYVGGRRALADLAAIKGRGLATWIFWRSAYLTKLVSARNKILVLFDWLKTVVFGRDISRF
ncbi:MAG TPA: FAD-dependent oxidoreductase [Bacteroidota bacterium]